MNNFSENKSLSLNQNNGIKDGWYVYCIIPKRKVDISAIKAIDREFPLSLISEKDIMAVVSKVSLSEFGKEAIKEKIQDVEWFEEKVRLHEEIVESIMKTVPLLPMRFSTIFLKEEKIKNIIAVKYNEFKKALKFLEAKQEWGVKIFCKRDILIKEIEKKDGEIVELKEKLKTQSSGQCFFIKRRLETLLDLKLREKENDFSQNQINLFSQLSVDSIILPLLTKSNNGDIIMVLNASFLIEKGFIDKFLNEIKLQNDINEKLGFKLICTGPWPPYNFSLKVYTDER